MKSKDRVTVAWIDPGKVEGAFTASMIDLFHARSHRIDGYIRIEGGLISRQRNEVVKTFLAGTAEWLLMLDSDEQVTPVAFDKLIETAHADDRPIVAGLYFGTWPRGGMIPTPVPHLYRRADDGVSVIPVLDYPRDRVIEVDAAGTGCMLVHRAVLEAFRGSADEHEGTDWCWFRDLPLRGMWLGEDLYFCRRAQALGFKIHAHTGAVLNHRRRYWLDDAQFEALRAHTDDPLGVHVNERPQPDEATPDPEKRDTAESKPLTHR
jgi:hypothetical protein